MFRYFDSARDVECRYQWLRCWGIQRVDINCLTFEKYVIAELEIARGPRVSTGLGFAFQTKGLVCTKMELNTNVVQLPIWTRN